METPRLTGKAVASNDTLEDSMQFYNNYSIIARDEQSFIRRNNFQTTQSTLVGIEMSDDVSWMVPDEISLFRSKTMSPSTSRLPPEGAEKKTRIGNDESTNLSSLSDCSQYKELLQMVNKYDLEDISVSEVPDKILPPSGGLSHRERINKHRAEGTDIAVPSTEQLLALLKDSDGLTPTKLYDRIMESSYPKKANPQMSESDMDITSCGRTQSWKSSARIDQFPSSHRPSDLFKVQSEISAKIEDPKTPNKTFGDSSFVAMSNSILDKDEKSMMEKYGDLIKQADITCPGDQPTLPWNVSNVTIFDLDTTGSLPPRQRLENSMHRPADGKDRVKTVQNDTFRLDDLAERIYALSPSTSFSSISKMILDSTRAPGDSSETLDWPTAPSGCEKTTK